MARIKDLIPDTTPVAGDKFAIDSADGSRALDYADLKTAVLADAATVVGAPSAGDVPSWSVADDGFVPRGAFIVVEHGATAATARPDVAAVYWVGSVAPDNIANADWFYDTTGD